MQISYQDNIETIGIFGKGFVVLRIGFARVSTAECRQVPGRQLDAMTAAECDQIFHDPAAGAASRPPNLNAHPDCLHSLDVLAFLDPIALAGSPATPSPL